MDDQDPEPAESLKQIITENTYIVEPEGYGKGYVLKQEKVHAIISQLLEQRLTGLQYDPVKSSQRAKQLADEVKEQVKALGCHRHKIVVQVLLGQRKGQAMRAVSRCLWDVHTDVAAAVTHESETMYCVCQVFVMYVE